MKFDGILLISGAILTGGALQATQMENEFFVIVGSALMVIGLLLHCYPKLKRFWSGEQVASTEKSEAETDLDGETK